MTPPNASPKILSVLFDAGTLGNAEPNAQTGDFRRVATTGEEQHSDDSLP